MTSKDRQTVESHFGVPFPAALVDLLGDETLKQSMPVVYRFPNKRFILEIQYLLDVGDPQHHDVERKRLAIAVTTDGFKLWVDLSGDKLEILQDEFGDIDFLGITIQDLLNAERASL